ncbi:hypothetical protein BKA69DRAFT_1124108 [Paraphysoderma sedebokerense]|nr:hypothetical protein BKA69DRAFT_1124108 [Paraphysoderma sedebokerense]
MSTVSKRYRQTKSEPVADLCKRRKRTENCKNERFSEFLNSLGDQGSLTTDNSHTLDIFVIEVVASKDDSCNIQLFGRTSDGRSVCIFVDDYKPYFYFPITANFCPDDLATFKEAVDENVAKSSIISIEVIRLTPLMYHRVGNPENYQHFLKITLSDPSKINALAKFLGSCDEHPAFSSLFAASKLYDTQVYEANIDFELRFMVDLDLAGCYWVTLPASKYAVVKSDTTLCDVTVKIAYTEIISHKSTDGWGEIPRNLRTMCLMVTSLEQDETSQLSSLSTIPPSRSQKGNGKNKKNQAVSKQNRFIAAISIVLSSSQQQESPDDLKIVLTHSLSDFVAPVVDNNTSVYVFLDEKDMLQGFRDLFVNYDCDILTGYDVVDHLTTLMERAQALDAMSVLYLSRQPSVKMKIREKQIYRSDWVRSKRRMAHTSNREFKSVNMIGRVVFDLQQISERNNLLRTYTFADTIMDKLNITKEVLDSQLLLKLWKEDRPRLVHYVLRDVQLALQLCRAESTVITNFELARVTGLNVDDVLERGQMIRMWSLLFRFCKSLGVCIPSVSDRNESGMQEGPLNFMPETGYVTDDPCVVLDFRSLYPSTLLLPSERNLLNDNDYEKGLGPVEAYFVKSHLKKGIVPQILESLLSERERVKSQMTATSDPMTKAVLNGRQLALKVSANAVYGFTGARESKLQCLPIAETTILKGAQMLSFARDAINQRYKKGEGCHYDCRVVYGDTDSLFVRVNGATVAQAIQLGHKISNEVSDLFPHPVIKLAFEKVYFPYLLINRKRYAGLKWTKAEKPDKVDEKGIESQRRDSCPVLIAVMSHVIRLLHPTKSNDPSKPNDIITPDERISIIGAVEEYIKVIIERMLRGALNPGEFVMSKGLWLGTEAEDYKAKQAHVELVAKIKKREPHREFKDGERVAFVYTTYGNKGFEKVEDILYALKNEIPLDYMYYLRHQLESPLTRILELLLPSTRIHRLFNGDHTRISQISSSTPSKQSQFKGFFTKQHSTCVLCKSKIPNVKDRFICDDCRCDGVVDDRGKNKDNGPEAMNPVVLGVYRKFVNAANETVTKATKVVSQCRQCQAWANKEVLCVNT